MCACASVRLNVYVCMCECASECVCVHVFSCLSECTCVHVCMYLFLHVCLCMRIVLICVCACMYIHVCMYVCAHGSIDACERFSLCTKSPCTKRVRMCLYIHSSCVCIYIRVHFFFAQSECIYRHTRTPCLRVYLFGIISVTVHESISI